MRWRSFAILMGLGGLTVTALGQSTFLYGTIENNRYTPPSGEFTVTLPVQPELGGTVTDTPQVVTFQNPLALHASIACFELDSTQLREEELRGRRDYLTWFFAQHVQPQFRQRFEGASIESARFMPEVLKGTLMVFNLLPGGSMLGGHLPLLENGKPPVAKRGNLLFVHHQHLYVVSIELAEKSLEAATFDWPVEQQDEVLRKRLMELVGRIEFSAPAA